MPRPAARPAPHRLVVVAALLAAALAGAGEARARGGAPNPGPGGGREQPIGAPIRDVPTTLSVPIDGESSVVLGLPSNFWVQCPRHSALPNSLAGRGLIAQYMNQRGGTWSMLYVGVVDVPVAEGMTPEARAAGGVADFGALLPEGYRRVDWSLFSGPVRFAPVPWKLDGKKAAAWRSARYKTRPAVAYGGPESVFVGECLVVQPPGTQRLVYVALDAKAGGTTLDKVTEQLAVKRTRDVNLAGRRVQLNDIFESADASRYPVRQMAFDLPAGFVLTPAVADLEGEWLWLEERLDAQGVRDAVLRIRHSPSDPALTLANDHDAERALWPQKDCTPSEQVPLVPPGQVAWVLSHPSPADGPTARSHTAVMRLDDQTLVMSWVTLSDAAQAERDRLAFLALVRSIDWTVRW